MRRILWTIVLAWGAALVLAPTARAIAADDVQVEVEGDTLTFEAVTRRLSGVHHGLGVAGGAPGYIGLSYLLTTTPINYMVAAGVWGDSSELFASGGFWLQPIVSNSRTMSFYVSVGTIIRYDEQKNYYYDYVYDPRTGQYTSLYGKRISRDVLVGPALGIEWVRWSRLRVGVDAGFSYDLADRESKFTLGVALHYMVQ